MTSRYYSQTNYEHKYRIVDFCTMFELYNYYL